MHPEEVTDKAGSESTVPLEVRLLLKELKLSWQVPWCRKEAGQDSLD